MFFFAVIPFGFLLTQYTITGFDACAHLSEETKGASMGAAKGIWQSILYSAIGGYILLLCVVFAVPNLPDGSPDNALGAGGVAPIFNAALGSNWAGTVLFISSAGPALLRGVLHDLGLPDDLRVQPRPRRARVAALVDSCRPTECPPRR